MNGGASFDLTDRVAVVTGGYGVLGGSIARGLALAGARIAVLGRRLEQGEAKAAELPQLGPPRCYVAPARGIDVDGGQVHWPGSGGKAGHGAALVERRTGHTIHLLEGEPREKGASNLVPAHIRGPERQQG